MRFVLVTVSMQYAHQPRNSNAWPSTDQRVLTRNSKRGVPTEDLPRLAVGPALVRAGISLPGGQEEQTAGGEHQSVGPAPGDGPAVLQPGDGGGGLTGRPAVEGHRLTPGHHAADGVLHDPRRRPACRGRE